MIMDVFALRDELKAEHQRYFESFVQIADERIRAEVEAALAGGLLFLGADEFGFHRALPRRERTVHIAGLGSLLGFVGVWAWTESLL